MLTARSEQLNPSAGDQSSARLKKTRLLALTEWGNVSLWSVHVSAAGDHAIADAGLQIGGRVCLLLLAASLPVGRSVPDGMQAPYSGGHAASLQQRQSSSRLGRRAAVLALPPDSPDQFFVGLDNAQVLRGSLYGEATIPKVSFGRPKLKPTPQWSNALSVYRVTLLN